MVAQRVGRFQRRGSANWLRPITSFRFDVDRRHRVLYDCSVARKLTAVRLREEHLEQLTAEAKRQDVPVSHLIRLAVSEFLERLKEKKKR